MDRYKSGPDGKPRVVIEQLISEIDLRPVRVGDVDQVDLVDNVLRFWFTLSQS